MTEPLFIERQSFDIEKEAMEAKLSDNPETWPQEVLQEALKQHPYLGTYDLTPIMREVNAERGYAIGFLLLRNKTARLATPAGQTLADEAGVKLAKIPVIVYQKSLKNIDVFIDSEGKPRPLNDRRVREAMFRPNIFDAPATLPPTELIGDQLMPPGRTSRMVTGRGTVTDIDVPATKLSAAKPPYIMTALMESIHRDDIARIEDELSANVDLAKALLTKQATAPFFQMLAKATPIEDDAEDPLDPNVVQVRRNPVTDDYELKIASSIGYDPITIVGDRVKLAGIVGPDMLSVADRDGVATVSTDPVVAKANADGAPPVERIEQFGEYRVRDATGREHLGWVIPSVRDFDGMALPVRIFTNGDAVAIQTDIAGSRVGAGNNLTRGEPRGEGFFFTTREGALTAYVPGTVEPYVDSEGAGFVFKTILGDHVRLRPTPGLKAPVRLGASEVAIPADLLWCPMGGTVLSLIETPEVFAKTASLSKNASCVEVISDGQLWSFNGPALNKIANEHKQMLEASDALFLACALGMDPEEAIGSLNRAQFTPIKIANCRTLQPMTRKTKTATINIPKFVLLKEAAGLNDINTVDKVLSLGFLTPENVGIFIEYLPDFEETVSKLAHMLTAIRLGLPDVPEQSVKSAMERMEEVLTALKELIHRKA